MRIPSGHGRKQLTALAVMVTCALAILPCPTAAAGEKDLYVSLHYEVEAATRGCWDEMRFRRGVAHRIGYDPFKEDAPLDVRIHVGGSALAIDGQVEWRDANGTGMGERRFVAKDGNCNKLMTEMSFAVSLQIEFLRIKPPKPAAAAVEVPPSPAPDSNAVAVSPSDVSAPTPPAPTEVASPAPEAPPSPTTPEAARKPEIAEKPLPEAPPEEVAPSHTEPSAPWALWAGAGPSLAWRLSPELTADGRLFLGIGRGALSVELGLEATYPSHYRRWDGSGFRHTLIGATTAICGHLEWLSACALGRASQVRITGQGVDNPRQPNGFVAQAGARVAATVHVAGPWSLATHLDALGLLTPSRVYLNTASVWEMPRFGGLVGIDVLARFR